MSRAPEQFRSTVRFNVEYASSLLELPEPRLVVLCWDGYNGTAAVIRQMDDDVLVNITFHDDLPAAIMEEASHYGYDTVDEALSEWVRWGTIRAQDADAIRAALPVVAA